MKQYPVNTTYNGIPDSNEYWILWVSGIQTVKSRDLAHHSNTSHFGPEIDIFQSSF